MFILSIERVVPLPVFLAFFHRFLLFFVSCLVLGASAAYLFIMWDSLGYSSHVFAPCTRIALAGPKDWRPGLIPGLSRYRTERNGSNLCIIHRGLKIMSTRLLLDTICSRSFSISCWFFLLSVFAEIGKKQKGKAFGRNFVLGPKKKKKNCNPGTNFHRLAVEKMCLQSVWGCHVLYM